MGDQHIKQKTCKLHTSLQRQLNAQKKSSENSTHHLGFVLHLLCGGGTAPSRGLALGAFTLALAALGFGVGRRLLLFLG